MNKSRINWIVVGITLLVLLNIALLATIWLQKKEGRVAAPGPRPGDENPLATELRFDSAQRRSFDTLRAEHFKWMQGYRKQMRDARDHYFDGIKSGAAPDNRIAWSIAALHTKMDSATYVHFAQVRALCNPQQQEAFDRLLRRIVNAAGRPGPRPSPDPFRKEDEPPHDGPPEDGPPPGP
ncbi:hypothetical protein [Flaviaesturariibacter aridisoli]|uniref:Periplasmic heavy metal sensor n=1 Tax=Flaviaesturariibacter aridisoli TaxID=2545761 RepID=A0A4R4E4A0_9BACT|nr:hypothetical protein [Flaviaesturariibacter aridisoli]TCZ71750.1 hypothetical protein E0486_09355 [Flaviaesturariibacter aridisoli]